MMHTESFRTRLSRERFMPIIRASKPDFVPAVAATLAEIGFHMFEVSLTTPRALELIRGLVDSDDRLCIGAGTVLTVDQVDAVADAGAEYIVTPGWADSIEAAHVRGLASAVGALTPSEIIHAYARGAAVVKIFPAEAGGPAYLSAVRAPLPNIPMVPVGGVTVDAARDYFARGAFAVGLGSPLLGDAAEGGSLSALAERGRSFLDLFPRGDR